MRTPLPRKIPPIHYGDDKTQNVLITTLNQYRDYLAELTEVVEGKRTTLTPVTTKLRSVEEVEELIESLGVTEHRAIGFVKVIPIHSLRQVLLMHHQELQKAPNLEELSKAWHVEGRNPEYHREQKALLAKNWPSLYQAIVKLL